MEASISSAKKTRGRPRVNATPVNVRIEPELLLLLEQFIAQQPDQPTRPEAIRRIVKDWLEVNGYKEP